MSRRAKIAVTLSGGPAAFDAIDEFLGDAQIYQELTAAIVETTRSILEKYMREQRPEYEVVAEECSGVREGRKAHKRLQAARAVGMPKLAAGRPCQHPAHRIMHQGNGAIKRNGSGELPFSKGVNTAAVGRLVRKGSSDAARNRLSFFSNHRLRSGRVDE
jgi:hypothetical protein